MLSSRFLMTFMNDLSLMLADSLSSSVRFPDLAMPPLVRFRFLPVDLLCLSHSFAHDYVLWLWKCLLQIRPFESVWYVISGRLTAGNHRLTTIGPHRLFFFKYDWKCENSFFTSSWGCWLFNFLCFLKPQQTTIHRTMVVYRISFVYCLLRC